MTFSCHEVSPFFAYRFGVYRKTRRFLNDMITATYILSVVILVFGLAVANVILKKKQINLLDKCENYIKESDMELILTDVLLRILIMSAMVIPVINIICSIVISVMLCCYAYKAGFE